jgi:hypothetical protein
MTIWKFPLDIMGEQEISVPPGAIPLCVQIQNDQPHLWALVDPNIRTREPRTVLCCSTGGPADIEDAKYLGTTQHRGGELVFHWFLRWSQ